MALSKGAGLVSSGEYILDLAGLLFVVNTLSFDIFGSCSIEILSGLLEVFAIIRHGQSSKHNQRQLHGPPTEQARCFQLIDQAIGVEVQSRRLSEHVPVSVWRKIGELYYIKDADVPR